MDGPTDLYETDFYAWTRQQADALRALASVRSNLPLDLEHLAEEVEDMGSERYFQVESNLRILLVHLIFMASAPGSSAEQHWRAEARAFRRNAARRATATIVRRLGEDWSTVWRDAVAEAGDRLATYRLKLAPLPGEAPLTPGDLLAETAADVDALVARLLEACAAP